MITLFLACVIGWYLVIMGVFLLTKSERVKTGAADILKQPGLKMVLAVFTLILGLLMVASHNLWIMDWPVVITLVCWIVLISGLIRLFMPHVVDNIGQSFIKNPKHFMISAIISILLGLFLVFKAHYQDIIVVLS